jgi:UDP-N-acetylmuramate dehydrogenase
VSEKHAGFIINGGNASASDVIDLLKYVSDFVFEKTGVRLEPEIRVIE